MDFRYHHDNRGFFSKIYSSDTTSVPKLKEISVSVSKNYNLGTIRGIHFQLSPLQETKLITCLSGSIFDVIVDLRPESPTFRKWAQITLKPSNSKQLYVPRGFAHGFQTLETNTEVLYIIWGRHSATHSRRIYFRDSDLSINWPLEVSEISHEDQTASSLASITSELK